MIIVDYLLFICAAYLLGSLPTGLIVSKVFGKGDLRKFGSGKTGATNVLRTVGKLGALIVVVFDFAKGAIPVIIAYYLVGDTPLAITGAFAATCGHVWPIFANFRGGRGVAAIMGGLLALLPWLGVLILAIGMLLLIIFRIASVMSLGAAFLGMVISIILLVFDHLDLAITLYVALGTMFLFFTHTANLKRLFSGEEPRVGLGGDRKEGN